MQPWQRDFLEHVYAPSGAPTIAVLSVPRKNGKTGLAARLCLAHLCGPEAEANGEVYSAANDRAQAAIVYRAMHSIIKRVPALQERLIVRDFDRSIEDAVTGSRYMALSADVPTKHGLSASFIVYDELGQAPKRDLYDVLETSMGARLTPLMLIISTQAPLDAHVMSELVDEVESPTRDRSMYGVVHRAPAGADIWDEDVWAAANPPWERPVVERIPGRRAPRAPSTLTPRKLPKFVPQSACRARHHLFRRCGVGGVHGRYPHATGRRVLRGARPWRRRPTSMPSSRTSPNPAPCLIGYGHRRSKWTAPRRPTVSGQSKGTYSRRRAQRQQARGRATTAALLDAYDVRRVTVDRWAIDELRRVVDEEGLYVDLQPMGQGYRDMAPAVSLLEAAVLERTLIHRGSPLLGWCFGNIEVDEDPAGNRKFTKKRAHGPIDPMVALLMALSGAATAPPVYSFQGSVIGL